MASSIYFEGARGCGTTLACIMASYSRRSPFEFERIHQGLLHNPVQLPQPLVLAVWCFKCRVEPAARPEVATQKAPECFSYAIAASFKTTFVKFANIIVFGVCFAVSSRRGSFELLVLVNEAIKEVMGSEVTFLISRYIWMFNIHGMTEEENWKHGVQWLGHLCLCWLTIDKKLWTLAQNEIWSQMWPFVSILILLSVTKRISKGRSFTVLVCWLTSRNDCIDGDHCSCTGWAWWFRLSNVGGSD